MSTIEELLVNFYYISNSDLFQRITTEMNQMIEFKSFNVFKMLSISTKQFLTRQFCFENELYSILTPI